MTDYDHLVDAVRYGLGVKGHTVQQLLVEHDEAINARRNEIRDIQNARRSVKWRLSRELQAECAVMGHVTAITGFFETHVTCEYCGIEYNV